eukprot:46484-Eustigmatos_ZCMA.PRE.1
MTLTQEARHTGLHLCTCTLFAPLCCVHQALPLYGRRSAMHMCGQKRLLSKSAYRIYSAPMLVVATYVIVHVGGVAVYYAAYVCRRWEYAPGDMNVANSMKPCTHRHA